MNSNLLIAILWAVVIVALVALNMALCYWMGYTNGKKRNRRPQILLTTAVPGSHDPVLTPSPASSPSHVIQMPGMSVGGRSNNSSIRKTGRRDHPSIRSMRGHTVVGITCHVPDARSSVSPPSYDSSVITMEDLSPAAGSDDGHA